MIDIIVVGEDEVTKEIIKRLLGLFGKTFRVLRVEPIRGGQIKDKFLNYNQLASKMPVFLLLDSDSECPVALRENLLQKNPISKNLLFRIAYDEAESWLMADRKGFAEFLKIDESIIPNSQIIDKKDHTINELTFPIKPSLFLMMNLAMKSKDSTIKEKLTPKFKAKKGVEYNTTLVPFIQEKWSIEQAMINSYSLRKAVQRLQEFCRNQKIYTIAQS